MAVFTLGFSCLPRKNLRLLIVLVCLPLAACTVLPQRPVSQVWLLPAQPGVPASGPTINRSLRVMQPSTSQFINSSRIAVQPQGAEITVYSGSRWSDSVPVLFRNRLTQELRTDGRFISVSSDEDNLQADFELGGDLSSFQGVYSDKKGEVLIQFDARLVQTSDRRVIASQRFVIHQPISGSSMSQVVEAFGLASDRLAADILRWLGNSSAMRSP
ncbi:MULTISPECIES: ABC-type transport auxiliary lipoprotein family protein [Klebsiella]|jgi:cholesterol transport system auxiliary component|nr:MULTISPECIES: ABC-type transport auxiliary lipoprotein family protein [Klebsiella]ELK7335006.1 membrane integrity-associated transporter subunit PqiC [Enterobacter cloacae]HDX9110461.1 membrane integrity-associated transporter subunit PqiC [Klebsiella michiganensis]EIY5062091.1 membrane integrity-associated transporter subunit PqiC [Klebsiella variicola]EIY5132250.1 membrane integrity-associated transporter subunit PqiC [Klebsiella variicola]EKT9143146.1 membrane integrity-associated transp